MTTYKLHLFDQDSGDLVSVISKEFGQSRVAKIWANSKAIEMVYAFKLFELSEDGLDLGLCDYGNEG